MMCTRALRFALLGATVSAFSCGTALAQSAPVAPTAPPAAATTAPAPASNGLEAIVVTARRTSENLERVPVAASVLGAKALERQQIRRATDLQFNAPSLVITPDPLGGSGTPVFQLRGLTTPLGADDTVVNYFADVPVDSRVIASGLFDLASVQILRGPQGTLFGKNSTGGAVLFTPQKAETDDFKGYVTGNLGNYNLRQVTGAVNIPLVKDVLAVRLSGQLARQDGMVKNLSGPDGNDKHYNAARLSVTFTPVTGFRNDLLVTYFDGKQHLSAPITEALGGFALFFPEALADLARQKQLGDRTVDQSFSPNNDNNKSYLVSNATSYDFGDVTLKNILGYSNTHNYFRLNATSFNFPLVDVAQDRQQHMLSDELQLSGLSFDKSLKWIVGGFYSRQKSKVDQVAILYSLTPTIANTTYDTYTSKALFGQATYDFAALGLNGLKLTGGLRHTWDLREGSSTYVPDPLHIRTKEFSYTIGLDYQVNKDILVYVAHRHSYKAGGFNLISTNIPTQLQTYSPEKLTDYEIGIKANGRLGTVPVRANLALYQGTYKNIQTQVTGSCNGIQNSLIVNAGKGKPKGLELELEARLFQHLQLSGFYNRTLGRYDSFNVPSVNGCVLSASQSSITGENFGNISKNTAGVTAVYTIPLASRGDELAINGNMYTRSRRIGNDLNGFYSPMPGYTIFNARIDYNNIGGSSLSAGVYVRNLTNKLYAVTRNDQLLSAGYLTSIYGDPRTYGVEATYKF